MSKGDSHLFSGTSGEGRALIDEVISNGDKISPDNVLMITRDPSGKIVWMGGTPTSGSTKKTGRKPVEFRGADNEIRIFEPLAITGLQLVEKVSAHSFHQKSIVRSI